MKFEFTSQSIIINNRTVDAIYVRYFEHWIPIPTKSAEISIIINSIKNKQPIGTIQYRAIKIDEKVYNFHQFRYEQERPELLNNVMFLVSTLVSKST